MYASSTAKCRKLGQLASEQAGSVGASAAACLLSLSQFCSRLVIIADGGPKTVTCYAHVVHHAFTNIQGG
jgi:hypothetical protein